MLENVYKSYRDLADKVEWTKYSNSDLFREYIKNENEPELKEKFFAGIVCRYWGLCARCYTKCNRHIPFEQCYDILIDAITYVINKRVWEDKNSSLYNDKAGPDKAFHIVLKRQLSLLLHNLNADKRRTNFNTLSIDGAHEDYNDAADGLLFEPNCITSDNYTVNLVIKDSFDKGNTLDGIMLDLICFHNYGEFSYQKIISLLNELGSDEKNYYKELYGITTRDYNKTLREIHEYSNKVLTVRLKRLLKLIKEEIY